MDKIKVARAFNEWMRRYIADPHTFQAEFQSVTSFQSASNAGNEPDYGAGCAAYLESLMA